LFVNVTWVVWPVGLRIVQPGNEPPYVQRLVHGPGRIGRQASWMLIPRSAAVATGGKERAFGNSAGVAVAVGVGVVVGVAVGVAVGVRVAVGVGLGNPGVEVAVLVGVRVAVGVGVLVSARVGVFVGV